MEPLELAPHDLAYVLFAMALAGLFWLAVLLLLLTSRISNHWLKRFGLIWIAANAGAFWLAAGITRYTGLSLERAFLFNMWSRVLYAMLALYLLGYAIMQYRVVTRGRP